MTVFVSNKKARFNYEIQSELEAGIQLLGFEVKALKEGKGDMEGSHAVIRGKEAFLLGLNIAPFQPLNTPESYDSRRTRKLLLTKKEIRELEKIEGQKGLTIVPLSVYNKERKIKVKLGIVKGKKKYDKRETIKKRDIEKDIRRELKVR